MKIGIHANICDSDTAHIASALHKPFESLSQSLEGEYGGLIEHLWIDLELIEYRARPDGKPRFPFRFQKRVSGRSHFGLPASTDDFNVGHYSVRPDFNLLMSIHAKQVIPYVFSLIYQSTELLIEKQKKLGGFDAVLFRKNFRDYCALLGYEVGSIEFPLAEGANGDNIS